MAYKGSTAIGSKRKFTNVAKHPSSKKIKVDDSSNVGKFSDPEDGGATLNNNEHVSKKSKTNDGQVNNDFTKGLLQLICMTRRRF